MSESLNQQIDRLEEIYKSEMDPQGRAFVPLADAHRRLGDLGKALAVLEEGLGTHPEIASAHMVAGWVHRSRKSTDDAMRSFERVLALDAENMLAKAAIAELIDDQRAQSYRDKMAAKESLPGVPRLLAPADQRVFIYENPTEHQISLAWQAVPGAGKYHLVISDQPLFTDPLYDAERSQTEAQLEVGPGTYYWKTAAVNRAGVEERTKHGLPADERIDTPAHHQQQRVHREHHGAAKILREP